MKQGHAFYFELHGEAFGLVIVMGEYTAEPGMGHDACLLCFRDVFLVQIDDEMLRVVVAYLEGGVVDKHGV